MQTMAVLGFGLVAGWLVNLLADTLPLRCSPLAAWQEPWRAVAGRDGAALHVWRTRLVWLAAIALGWLAVFRTGLSMQAGVLALYAWFFLTIAVIDLEHRRVLNRMLVAALPVLVAASLWLGQPAPLSALAGAVAGFGFFLSAALLRRGGIGMGDVKLAGVIGLATGLGGVLVALVVGIFAGGVAALLLLVWTRFDRRATMAYAPYLVVGAWAALFFGSDLWALYVAQLTRLAS